MGAFAVEATVRGAPRPRAVSRGGHAGTYMPDWYGPYKDAVARAWASQDGERFGAAPVAVRVDVFRRLPDSRPRSMASEPDTMKPDADNVAKAVLDALTQAGAWDDDSQVVWLKVVKHPRERAPERIEVRTAEWGGPAAGAHGWRE